MKRKLLTSLLDNTKQKGCLASVSIGFIFFACFSFLLVTTGVTTGIGYGMRGIYKKVKNNPKSLLKESKKLIRNINDKYDDMLLISKTGSPDNPDNINDKLILEQLSQAKNPQNHVYSIKKIRAKLFTK